MTYSKEFNEGNIYRDVSRVKEANQGLTATGNCPSLQVRRQEEGAVTITWWELYP